MELSEQLSTVEANHPLDTLEAVLSDNDWVFERVDEDELSIAVQGHWCSYHLSYTWHPPLEALHLSCSFDLKVRKESRQEITMLLALINEQLWAGHFDMWSEDGMILFRHGVMLQGDAGLTLEQAEALLQVPVDACERYFPAFQFVLWAGKSAVEAMAASMFETVGRA